MSVSVLLAAQPDGHPTQEEMECAWAGLHDAPQHQSHPLAVASLASDPGWKKAQDPGHLPMGVEPSQSEAVRARHVLIRTTPAPASGRRVFRRHPGLAVSERPVTEPVKQLVGAAGGMQVVIKHPVPGRKAVPLRVVGVGDFGGVRAEQVVKGEPPRDPLGYKMCPGHLG
jgi:hypothetical protein